MSIDPLAMDKLPNNILQRQRAADGRAEDGARFWLTEVSADGRYVRRQVGGTADRPVAPQTGDMFFDTTLAMPIWYDGTQWIDAAKNPV